MKTHTESLWLLLIAQKFPAFSATNMALVLLFISFVYLAMSMLHWWYPGGPAWGYYIWKEGAKAKAIPGPRGYPIIGSMNLMLNLAHQKLAAVAHALGAKRLMAFSLGESRVILTCHPEVGKEILNSLAFADRPVKESAYALMFNRAIGFASHGLYWRTLRRIAANHLFSPNQMNCSESQRLRIARPLVQLISSHQGEFQVRDILKRASLNHMVGLVFGLEYESESGFYNNERDELIGLVEEGYELLGQLNWADHLPWLASFDPQKIRHRCSKLVPKVSQFVHRVISEHRRRTLGNGRNQDFVDVLLSLDGPNKLSDSDMVAVLWEMIFRGTDTVAVLMEWILARMVLHPEFQSKVQNELDDILGESQKLTESIISEMKYLKAVLKEILRLHPPGPLLSWARLATTDTTIDGHFVPAGTTAMVNMWAITRDPDIWSDPLVFRPERFMARHGDMDFSVMGSDLRLAPFGSGRRACPGKVLGLTTVSFWVATLLHEFKWVPSDHNPVDLSEILKMSCEMAKPLTVKVWPRLR